MIVLPQPQREAPASLLAACVGNGLCDVAVSRSMDSSVGLGHLLPGAQLLGQDKGVNETYRGNIEVAGQIFDAFVKVLPPRQLINELLASVLGRSAGLPIPRAFLVLVDPNEYSGSDMMRDAGGTPWIGFATVAIALSPMARRVDLQTPVARQMFLSQWPGWPDAVTFDDWIANCDRHFGNLLAGAPGEVWLIDHSHAFTGPNWNVASLDPDCVVRNRLCTALLPLLTPDAKTQSLQLVNAAVGRFMQIDINTATLASRIKGMLASPEFQALSSFVASRLLTTPYRVASALGVPLLPFSGPP